MKSFFNKIYKGDVNIQGFPVEIISEVIGYSNKKCFVVVDDDSFYEFFDLNLSWDLHKILLLPPKSLSANITPAGFKSYYEDSMKLFNVVDGSIIINKIDIADKEWLDLVEKDITRLVRGSFLEDKIIHKVSTIKNIGLVELKD